MKKEILYGYHSVHEAIRAGRRRIFSIILSTGKNPHRLSEILDFGESRGIQFKQKSTVEINRITGTDHHQGIAAEVDPYPLVSFHHLLGKDGNYCLLVLDGIQDVQNIGALVRTALCSGIYGVIIPKNRSVSPTPAVSKTSAGALEHIRVTQVVNIVSGIQELKKAGFWIIGLDRQGKNSVFEFDFPDRTALVIGSEQKGIRPLVKKQCDFLLSIPQEGPVDSLNASTAGAVVMYEMFRKKMGK